MALFSIITIWADHPDTLQKLTAFQTTWYFKPYPTFLNTVASIHYRIWWFQFSNEERISPSFGVGYFIFALVLYHD